MQTSKVYGEKIGNEVSRVGEEAEAKAGNHRAEKRTQKNTDNCVRGRENAGGKEGSMTQKAN